MTFHEWQLYVALMQEEIVSTPATKAIIKAELQRQQDEQLIQQAQAMEAYNEMSML